ncbi:phage tail protein [Pectobacterium versatile]|uniref:phage tail tape measure protein n=1 Tax=Pectobacterium versatile TaxID=2488639 RepID=UPI001B3A14FE|nr:phage tail tape measure protein [Pectobacterium versatile]MBQ4781952.1 phage tail protein [Pectobacterium versatile]MBQ4786412.1 phage tail protein [Pectobacterium versatile]
MGKRLDTEIIINLAGNLTAKARQYGANMSEFARRNERAMSVIKSTSAAAGRGLDMLGNRYTGMIAGFAGGAMLREFTQLDRRMTRIGIASEKTREEMASMLSGMQDASIKFRVDDSEVVNAIEKVGTVTGDIDFGYKNRNAIAASIAASGGTGESIGGLFANFTKFQVQTEEEAIKAMDTLNKLGKEGAFELKDIAEKGVRAFSMYAAAGGRGVSGIKDVGVVLESAIDVTGDRDTAATATENLIRDLQNPKVAKALKANGINVFDKSGKMRELPVLLDEVAKRSGRKGAEKQNANLLNAGFNQDSILLISSVTSGKGAENLKRYQAVVGDGVGIMKDAEYAAKDFTSAMQSMNTTWNKFANSQLAAPVQALADALNSVDQETVQNWLEIGKNVALATGGLIAARKAFQIGKGAYDFLKPRKKGVPQGVTDIFGSGVMPVYVTNMPDGGVGSGSEKSDDVTNDALDVASELPDKLGTFAKAIKVINVLSELVDFDPFTDEGKKVMRERLQKNNERSSENWNAFKEWISSASDQPVVNPAPWASMQSSNSYPFIPQQLQGEIEVTVKDDRVQVSKVKINTPGVTMSAQTGISNVEQD